MKDPLKSKPYPHRKTSKSGSTWTRSEGMKNSFPNAIKKKDFDHEF